MASYWQAGEILGSWTIAKRDKCWVLGQPPSETNAGFSDCRQARQMLGSRTAAKREKCWVPGLSPSGYISIVEKIAERTKRNPSPACGRGAGVRAFIRRTNLVKRDRQAFFALLRRFATPPPAGGRRDWLCEFLFWVTAKRDKCWVLGLSPSGKNAGFSDCRQARESLFVYRPPSGVVPLFSVFVLPFLTGGKS